MNDYISRQVAVNRVKYASLNELRTGKWSDDLSAADVRKNIKAQKVLAGGIMDGTTHWYECSCCHGAVDIQDAYCKHCGAVLELENDL